MGRSMTTTGYVDVVVDQDLLDLVELLYCQTCGRSTGHWPGCPDDPGPEPEAQRPDPSDIPAENLPSDVTPRRRHRAPLTPDEIDAVLTIARAHGTPPAAEWAGTTPATVVRLRKLHDGYDRGRGHPTAAELEARQPRRDCPCPMCTDERDRERRRSSAAWDATRSDGHGYEPPDDAAWRLDANCRGTHPDPFFAERGESVADAKAICAGCTVRDDCLEYALNRKVKHGIWGGLSERERRRIRSRRT